MNHEEESHKRETGEFGPEQQIHYREYKLLLKPERFADEDGFHKFYKHAHHVAKGMGVHLEKSEKHEQHVTESISPNRPCRPVTY